MVTCTIEAKQRSAFINKKAIPFIANKFVKEGETSLPKILNALYTDLQEKNNADEVRAFNFVALLSPALFGFSGGSQKFRTAVLEDLVTYEKAVKEFFDNSNAKPLMTFLGIDAKKANEGQEANEKIEARKKKPKVKPTYQAAPLTTTAREANTTIVEDASGKSVQVVSESLQDRIVKANGLFTRLFILAGKSKPMMPAAGQVNVAFQSTDPNYTLAIVSADRVTEDSRIEAIKDTQYKKGMPIIVFKYAGTDIFVRIDNEGNPLRQDQALAGEGILAHTFVRDKEQGTKAAARKNLNLDVSDIEAIYDAIYDSIKQNPELEIPLKAIGGRLGIVTQVSEKSVPSRFKSIPNVDTNTISIQVGKYGGFNKMFATFRGYDYYNPLEPNTLGSSPDLLAGFIQLLKNPNISALDKEEGAAFLTARHQNLLSFDEAGNPVLTPKGGEPLTITEATTDKEIFDIVSKLFLPAVINTENVTVPVLNGEAGVELVTIPTEEFVYEHYSIVGRLSEKSQELLSPHATIAFEVGIEGINEALKHINKSTPRKTKTKKQSKDDLLLGFQAKLNDSDVLKKADTLLNEATPEQQKEAEKWWSQSPLSKHIPLNKLFGIVNSGQLANFGNNGITLYAGSNMTDVYHEAWHGFTQLYLTKAEKIALYKEVQKILGDVSYLKAEEELAEDFRKYMMDSKRVLGRSKKINSIFKKILDFLQALFGPKFLSGLSAKVDARERIAEIYEGLAVGSILENRNPTYDNAMFLSLDKGIQVGEDDYLSTAYSKQVSDTLDSMIVEILQMQKSDISAIFRTSGAIEQLYETLKERTEVQIKILELELEGASEERAAEIENSIEILEKVLENFGSAAEENSTVGYHMRNSQIMKTMLAASQTKDETAIDEEENNILEESNDLFDWREMNDKSGNEVSPKQLLSAEIDLMLRTIPEVDKKGEAKLDRFGMPLLKRFGIVFNTLQDDLAGISTKQDILDRINAKAIEEGAKKERGLGYNNTYEHILSQIQSGEETNNNRETLAILLWQGFNKAFIETQIGLYNPLTDLLVIKSPEGDLSKLIKKIRVEFQKSNPQGINLKEVLDKHDPTKFGMPGNLYSFIRDLGLELPLTYELERHLSDFRVVQQFSDLVYPSLVTLAGNKFTIKSDPYKILTKPNQKRSYSGQSGIFKELLNVALSAEEGASVNRRIDPEGKNVYNLSLNSSQTQLLKALNNVESLVDLKADPRLSRLHPDNNPHAKQSVFMQTLFDFETGKRRQYKRGPNKGQNINLDLKNILGIFATEDLQGKVKAEKNAKLQRQSKIIQDIHTLLTAGFVEQPRVSDKSTSVGVRIKAALNGAKPSATNGLFIRTMDKAAVPEMHYFIDKLQGELELMQLYRTKETNTTRKSSKDLALFSDIIKFGLASGIEGVSKLEEVLNKAADSTDSISASNLLAENNLEGVFESLLENYFDAQADAIFTRQLIRFENLYQFIGDESTPIETRIENARTLTRNFVMNVWLMNAESSLLFTGELGQYKDANDYIKRNALTSTGNLFASDQSTQDYVNTLTDGYASSVGAKQRKYTGVLRTAILTDIDDRNDQILSPLFEAGIRQYAKDNNLSDEVADSLIQAYKDTLNEADGQAFISFDAYRKLSIVSGEWNWNTQEPLYQKIVAGDRVSPAEVSEFFPVRKYQYYGPILNAEAEGIPLNATALHKYSLKPIIPSPRGAKKRSLDYLHEAMAHAGLDYVVFESGSKINNVGATVDTYTFNEDGTRTLRPVTNLTEDFNSNVNEIHVDFLKDVTKVKSKFKGEAPASSQLRGLLGNLIYNGGKVVKGKEGLEQEYQKFLGAIEALIQSKISELKEVFKSNDASKIKQVVAKIKRDLNKRETPENLIDALDMFLNKQDTPNMDALTNAKDIEAMLLAVLNKELVKTKLQGEALVQVASTFSETESDVRYSNDLRFYTYENGKVLPAEAKVPLQGNFVNLLGSKYKGKVIGTIERLNQAIKDPKWLDYKDNRKLITITGVRIPVQGLNSMEVFQIAEFLNPSEGNSIIVPTELATKSGGDYDVDKLTLFFPKSKVVGLKTKEELTTDKILAAVLRRDLIAGKEDLTQEELDAIDAKIRKELRLGKDEVDAAIREGRTIVTLSKGGVDGIQNDIVESISNILLHPSNYLTLLSPNSTNIVKEDSSVFNTLSDKLKDPSEKNVGSVLNHGFNVTKQQENSQGKQGLGIIASANVMMVPLQSVSESLPKTIHFSYNRNMVSEEEAKVADEALREKATSKPKRIKFTPDNIAKIEEGSKTTTLRTGRVNSKTGKPEFKSGIYKIGDKLYGLVSRGYLSVEEAGGVAAITKSENFAESGPKFKHTQDFLDGKRKLFVIDIVPVEKFQDSKMNKSLETSEIVLPIDPRGVGQQRDVEGTQIKSRVVEQLINGFVDIAKDAWIFRVNLNSFSAPDVIAMVALGVPYETAAALINTGVLKKYYENKASVKDPLVSTPEFYSSLLDSMGLTTWEEVDAYLNNNMPSRMLTVEEMLSGKFDKQAMAIYVQALPLIKRMADIIRAIKVDTVTPNTINQAQMVIEGMAKFNDSFSKPIIEQVLNNSIQGTYKEVKEFQVDAFKDLFPIRSNRLITPPVDMTYMRADEIAKIVERYKQHFTSFLFQNFKNPRFNKLAKLAKDGPVVIDGIKIEFATLEEGTGVLFKDDNTLVLDYAKIQGEYYNNSYAEAGIVRFATEGEYVNHVIMKARVKAAKPTLTDEQVTDYVLRRTLSPSVLFTNAKGKNSYSLVNQWKAIQEEAAQYAESDLIDSIFIYSTPTGLKLGISARYNLDPMEYIEDIEKLSKQKGNVGVFFRNFSERIALQDNFESHDRSLMPFILVDDVIKSMDEAIKWFQSLTPKMQETMIKEFNDVYYSRKNDGSYIISSDRIGMFTPVSSPRNIKIKEGTFEISGLKSYDHNTGVYEVTIKDNAMDSEPEAIVLVDSEANVLDVMKGAKPSRTYWEKRLNVTEETSANLGVQLVAKEIPSTTQYTDEQILEELNKCGI